MGITENIVDNRTQTQPTPAQRQATQRQAQTVGDAFAPLLEWEQRNLELWIQVAQLVVLVLIWREVS